MQLLAEQLPYQYFNIPAVSSEKHYLFDQES